MVDYLPQKGLSFFFQWGSLFAFFLGSCAISPSYPPSSIQSATSTKLHNLLLAQQGKFVLLHFWVSYYPNTQTDLKLLQNLLDAQKKQVAIIGISLDANGISVVKPFVEPLNLDYPILIGGEELAKLYKVSVLPKTFLFNPKGTLIEEFSGSLEWDQLISKLSLP